MNKLIITADDYGMSKSVNEAIDEGITAGLISSTNVMTNMPFYQEAQKLREISSVSVGMHWTLSCGCPVSDIGDIPSLVNEKGEFYKYPEFRERYRKRLINDAEIIKELHAQYELFLATCGKADYWNTHQNVHVDFHIYRLFVETAASLNINKMRSHQRIYVPASSSDSIQPLSWRIIEPVKSKMLDHWQKNAHKKGIESPSGLIVCLNNSDVKRPEYVFANINWKKGQIGEYVIHPAKCCDSPFFGRIVDQRILEYKLFSSNETQRIIENNDIEIVNYSILGGH